MGSLQDVVRLALCFSVLMMPWWATGQNAMPTGEQAILNDQTLVQMGSAISGMDPSAYAHHQPPASPVLDCPDQPFRVHVFSQEPLMIYIEDFVSKQEATHLINRA